MQNDEVALESVKTALNKGMEFQLDCVTQCVQNNMFETNKYLMHNYFFERTQKFPHEQLLKATRTGIKRVNSEYSRLIHMIDDKLKKPIVMNPPFQWAQDLNKLEFEIKYAYRHDVAGCADLFN